MCNSLTYINNPSIIIYVNSNHTIERLIKMLDFILRKTVLRKMKPQQQMVALLLKDKIRLNFIFHILVFLFGALPIASTLALLLFTEHTLSNVIQYSILTVSYNIFFIWFIMRFYEQIGIFIRLLTESVYSSKYVLKGNAISEEDFATIEKENKKIHHAMLTQQVNGYCYSVCFELLKMLKKGKIQFVAVRYGEIEKDENNYEYTMHVLYVYDNWCYDTYSERQYPIEKVLHHMQAKTYVSFSYEDIEGKSYEEFRDENAPALKEWCLENECHQEWSKY